MQQRITPYNITSLSEKEIFVFGSNEAGIHGAGAAKTAMKWGAVYGRGAGLHGKTYAIPTKDYDLITLPIESIKVYVDQFIEWAKYHSGNTFLVTEIGCGLAGYEPKHIAPLFKEAIDTPNIHLPARFWDILKF